MLTRDNSMYKKMIMTKLQGINEIPTMLTVATEIDRLTNDPNSSAEGVSNVIKNDPALTAKVLKIANSALFAGTQRIVSLNQAVARLGYGEIRRVTIAIAFLNSFKSLFVDYEKFWIHSITTAYIAQKLNELSKTNMPSDRLFTGALLHDIGILILDQYFTTIYKKIFDMSINKKYDLSIVEQKILGITHAEVGALLLKKWNVPDQITDIIYYHHQPQNSKIAQRDTKIVYLANFIANNRGYDNGTGTFHEQFYDDIWMELRLSVEQVPEIIESVQNDVEKAKQLLKLGGK